MGPFGSILGWTRALRSIFQCIWDEFESHFGSNFTHWKSTDKLQIGENTQGYLSIPYIREITESIASHRDYSPLPRISE